MFSIVIYLFRNSSWCDGVVGTALAGRCGRPAGIAFNEKTGELYVADAPLGLHVVSPAGGLAVKIADSVDGKPFKFLDGLDVDPTTGVVYFTSFSSRYTPMYFSSLFLLIIFTKSVYGKYIFNIILRKQMIYL